MVKKIIIANIKRRITAKDQKKIMDLAKSITSNKYSIHKEQLESPNKGIREISFETAIKDNHSLVKLIFIFLQFVQGIDYLEFPEGEWYSLKCHNYIINLNEDGENQIIKI